MTLPIEFPKLHLDDKQKEKKITEFLSNLIVNEEKQSKVMEAFLSEINLGLMLNPPKVSSIQMANTFVDKLIDGSENGEYLALDLGSTNFRVIFIELDNGKIIKEDVEYFDVPEDKKHGKGKYLFEYLASCISIFSMNRSLEGKKLKLGFTFSFPMFQTAINVAPLKAWTKNYSCPDVVGKDVVALLQDEINKHSNLNIEITAIFNDTTGTLLQGLYQDRNCAIGLILGTGHNACYIEKTENVGKWEGEHSSKEVIINMECGAFGDNGVLDFLRTEWDNKIDEQSLFRKSFTFEKYIGGKFLGDLVREVLSSLSSVGLFTKSNSNILQQIGFLESSDIASIESENFTGETKNTEEILAKLGVNYNNDDICIMKYVSGLISYRSIVLVSIVCATLLQRMRRKHCAIAIDGSLYEKHPRYKPLLNHLIARFAPHQEFNLLLAKDGSGKGAGLLAAVLDRK